MGVDRSVKMRATAKLVRTRRNVVPAANFATNPLASLFGSGPTEAGVSLTTPLPGVNVPASSAPVKTHSEMTTLSNGVRVISENTPGHCASMGVFVGSGSRDETDATSGAAKFMESMAFKASSGHSGFGFHHEIEHMVVVEAAHTAAFGNSGLGRTLVPSAKKVDGLSGGALAQFAVQSLTADKLVVAGAGVEHADFVSQVEAAFAGIAPASAVASEASKYSGGQFCLPGEPADGMTHAFLGFNSASWNSKDLF